LECGDGISAGYDFTGASGGATVVVTSAVAQLHVSCNQNGPYDHIFTLKMGPDVATYKCVGSGWQPSGDQKDGCVWQAGAVTMPDLCNGGSMWVNAQSNAVTFNAAFQSSESNAKYNVRFHYGMLWPKQTSGSWSATVSVNPCCLEQQSCGCSCQNAFLGQCCEQNRP